MEQKWLLNIKMNKKELNFILREKEDNIWGLRELFAFSCQENFIKGGCLINWT